MIRNLDKPEAEPVTTAEFQASVNYVNGVCIF
jgi:hypothetical protein